MEEHNPPSDGQSTTGQLLDALSTSAVVLSTDGRVLHWNDRATELFGWQAGEVLGEVPPFVPLSEEGRWRECLERARDDASITNRFRLQTLSGAPVRADVRMEPLSTDIVGGDEAAVLVNIEDKTQFVDLQNRVNLFGRVLRHNLRNDLNLVTGYAKQVADEVDDEHASSLAMEIRHIAQDVMGISDTARRLENVLSGNTQLEDIQLDDVVTDLTTTYESAATIKEDLDPVQVRAVPHLHWALDQLLANAVKHTDAENPTIRVEVGTTVEDGKRWAEVSVADNGPGIPEEERTVLTEGTETVLRHGSGLGLWLVYWIVEKSNGELQYSPNTPRGSIVTARLLIGD